LVVGLAGAAAAQTQPTGAPNAQPGWNSSHPQSSYAAPTSPAPQPNYGQSAARGGNPGTATNQGRTAATQSRSGANPQIMEAQQRLRALGLYSGPADGIMDPDTRAALANFQRQHKLRDTEGLDQQTMSALMSAQPTTATGSSTQPTTTPPTGMLNNAPASTAAGGNTGPAGARSTTAPAAGQPTTRRY
jgi:hypothetical protein